MAAPAFTTYIEATNLALQSVGHPTTTDVASSVDEAILRMGFYVNQSCNELLYQYDWQELMAPYEISVIADFADQVEKAFDLPVDFANFIDDTHWNRSMQLPAIGPVSPQDWQWMVVRRAKVTTRFLWRIRGGKLWIKSPPVAAQPLVFEYLQRTWARDGLTDAPKELMTLNSDYHVFAWNLVVLLARAKWLEQEGYDSSAAKADFQKAMDFYTGGDKGATALSLVPGVGYPYINAVRNIPPTGFGT
jgi:hypothetical protein